MSELLAKKKKKKKKKKTETVSTLLPSFTQQRQLQEGFRSKMLHISSEGEKVADTHQSITAADSLYARENGLSGFSLRRTDLKMSPDGLFC